MRRKLRIFGYKNICRKTCRAVAARRNICKWEYNVKRNFRDAVLVRIEAALERCGGGQNISCSEEACFTKTKTLRLELLASS